ncbi:2OG-Fe(II) oxygenase [Flexivirga oryzae]|uniref:Prolyl 4-hydroxylase alpha subunit Fe(2+) 2OG dioxygenase domain-containing protein n=1 Tax=Flexivirga oryzae TaxID=1794944 RepID=A0A839N1F8_9MICO|nr:2OG-Fe(II) oxygenase [Flexivirga oryzae]MBB2890639.1 hypothetical protein [Flexivirga oryzae]
MPTTPRNLLVRLLAGAHDTPTDSALARLRSDALRVDVGEVGELTFPIRAAQAKKLIAVARPAAFGQGEETLHDSAIRDTWELTPDQVRLGGDQWERQLGRVLDVFRDELGLTPGAQLRAELHSMLVYGKGQFFLPHQDSEKHDEMVATLVVSLPSIHTGGELVVDDRGKERIYRSSRDELTLVAFYADRRHEVRRVRSGHRISLTFNLLATLPTEPSSSEPVSRAANLLTDHFTTPVRRPYDDRDLGTPTRLAFLLDHEYTQRGLAAGRFKGADAEQVKLLRAAASQAGCECLFAQADVHETRDAVPDTGWQSNWYDGEFDEDGEDEGADVTVGDVIDEEVFLGWWITPGASRGEKIQLALYGDQVCAATPSAALTPYESEYEGYMGNYGNTVDRWYHRAAVVVWPKDKAFANRAEADPTWALRAVQRKIKTGDLVGARADALSMEHFWSRAGLADLRAALKLASQIRDPGAATVILASYELEALSERDVELLTSVVTQYGETWWAALLDRWDPPSSYGGRDRLEWITGDFTPVCRALTDASAAPIAEQLAERMWQWLWQRIPPTMGQRHPGQRGSALAGLGPSVACTLEVFPAQEVSYILDLLRGLDERADPLLLTAIRSCADTPSAVTDALAKECWERTVRRLAQPTRAADDWSIAWSGCGCADCADFAKFLGSRTDRALRWPMAERRRQHIESHITSLGLPVSHTTERTGRPYSLLLTKTEELFTHEARERHDAETDLRWLVATFG